MTESILHFGYIQTGLPPSSVIIGTNFFHSVILMSGNNSRGQLGDNTTNSTEIPITSIMQYKKATGVTEGEYVSTAIQLSCGSEHTIVLLKNGKILACGDNTYGQIGQNNTGNNSIISINYAKEISSISNAIAISCGYFHTVVLLQNGTVWTFGRNNWGQLGRGTNTILDGSNDTTNNYIPLQVPDISGAIAISAGAYHTAILLQNNTIVTFGRNDTGQLGNNTTTSSNTPVTPTLTDAIAISCGFDHTGVLLNNGTVKFFGNNNKGQLGIGTDTTFSSVAIDFTNADITGPPSIPGTNNRAIGVACGCQYSIIVLQNGKLIVFGLNDQGQLGLGTGSSSNDPVTPRLVTVTRDNNSQIVSPITCLHKITVFMLQSVKGVMYCGNNIERFSTANTSSRNRSIVNASYIYIYNMCFQMFAYIDDIFFLSSLNNHYPLKLRIITKNINVSNILIQIKELEEGFNLAIKCVRSTDEITQNALIYLNDIVSITLYYVDNGVTINVFNVIGKFSPITQHFKSTGYLRCFVKGTNILTSDGYKPIETLKIGDLVKSNNKDVKIKNITYALCLSTDYQNLPYCIKKNSLGIDYPINDLYLTPIHAFKYEEKLCHPKCIKNSNIFQVIGRKNYQLYNIELESYGLITAEGIECDTLLDSTKYLHKWSCSKNECKLDIKLKSLN